MKSIKNVVLLFILASFTFGCVQEKTKEKSNYINVNSKVLQQLYSEIQAEFSDLRPKTVQPAEGYLKYPYLIPAGYYKHMWDWDGFFIANHFISMGKPEYMKFWALNLIESVDEDGYVSGCITTKGPRPIFGKFSMKPFLSQGVFLASNAVGDYSWVQDKYNLLKEVIAYRELTQQDEKTGLFFWEIAMQSGADNNAAMNYFKEDTRSYLSCDASAWQLREYRAQANIAEALGKTEDAKIYSLKATKLQTAINQILWCDADKMFYNVDRGNNRFYKRVSYSSFVPLLAKVASRENGRAMIEKYLLNEEVMKADFGFRSLSKQDPDYNNKNIIVPFSNWQGPVWPIANYIYSIGMKHYGFDGELEWLALTLGDLLVQDVQKCGSLHETYHADTGEPLAPSADHVDEDGKFVGFISWNLCVQNILQGVIEDKWMLLEIE